MKDIKLTAAIAYENEQEGNILPEERPLFHLSPKTGWLNDPNGFSFYKGQYHLFYQYHPYRTVWGPMHWGHAVSDDMLHWRFLPCAMAPDEDYDQGGVFSGSALTLDDGRHLLMYTGVTDDLARQDNRAMQVQCVAVGDGLTYTKYEGNPVLDVKDIPEGCDPADFRDPKIWRHSDGTFRAICANRSEDGSGQILLFESPDGFSWKLRKVFLKNENRYGLMWECPDFFTLDGKGVLLVSPMDMLPQGFEFHNGNSSVCFLGSYDEETETFSPQRVQAIDSGIDFYACQTLLTPDGRRVMIGWMQNPDCSSYRVIDRPWYGQMTLPREIFIKDNRLWQQPVRELEAMRKNPVIYNNIFVENECRLDGLRGRAVDMTVRIRPADIEHPYHKFILRFAMNDQFYTQFSFRYKENVLKLDRKFSGSRRAVINQRRCLVRNRGEEIKLRVILDRFSVEVFINDGEQAMTALLYTDKNAENIMFFSDGAAVIDVEKYDLEG